MLDLLRQYHGMRVEVSPWLPFESTDPERPGLVHAVRCAPGILLGPVEPVLFVSAEAFEQLKLAGKGAGR